SVLNEAERIIVEILQNQPGEEIDQNKLVTISGFSKAKVSRIIKSLEERGVVESIRYGRKNKIILKKKFVKEATEQSENKN
ncbi:MAG: winged helix-turn-helix transcriptional regulator, partial [Candidatus Micrarchaeia archaeon]